MEGTPGSKVKLTLLKRDSEVRFSVTLTREPKEHYQQWPNTYHNWLGE